MELLKVEMSRFNEKIHQLRRGDTTRRSVFPRGDRTDGSVPSDDGRRESVGMVENRVHLCPYDPKISARLPQQIIIRVSFTQTTRIRIYVYKISRVCIEERSFIRC